MDSTMIPSTSALTSTGSVGPNNSRATACPFRDKLPLEIRLMIYRKLLVRDLNPKSEEYDFNREAILKGPDHSYDFHPTILATNRQIHREAMDLFQRENVLVSMTYDNEVYRWNTELRDCGVAIVAKHDQARACPTIGLIIDLNANDQATDNTTDSREQRATSLFMLEDLSAACIFLQRRMDRYNSRFQNSNIRVTVCPRVVAVSNGSEGDWLLPKTQASRYLGPLWHVHGATRVEIDGPVDPTYRAATIASMCGRRLKAKEYMRMVGAQFDEGDKASNEDGLWTAIAAYKAALMTIRGSSFDAEDGYQTLVGGRFHGHLAGRARETSEVRLHSLIADAYLRCGKYRMARIYVERIYGPLYSMDDRVTRQKLPLDIPQDNQVASGTYAELLHVAARISLVHGQEGEAIAELNEACDLDPWNAAIPRLLEQVRARRDARVERRYLQQKYQMNCAEEKHEAAVLVASNRKTKGDEAFANHELTRAQRYYAAAYDKVQNINSVSHQIVPTSLTSEVLSKLITTSLELNDSNNVHRYADDILATESRCWWSYKDIYRKDSDVYTRETFYTAYYSKAVAFQNDGKFDAAIRNFENAWLCDSRCEATYYQLRNLKQRKEVEEMERNIEIDSNDSGRS